MIWKNHHANPAVLEMGAKKIEDARSGRNDARSMGRSKKNLRRISETVTAYNLQRLADMDKTSPSRVVDKLVRDRMIELREAVKHG